MNKRGCAYFVWTKSIGGPRPLVVFAGPDDEPCLEAKLKAHVLAAHFLHAHEATMTFPQLEALYPPPKEACQ